MSHVTVIATGGTIASGHSGDASVIADRKGAVLLASLHDPLEGIVVKVVDFVSVGSYALDLGMVHQLIKAIGEELAREDCDGVVVTHGTDTMEETGFIADLLVPGDKPIVFTGAQRHADMPDTDGPRNIADAVRVAADPAARGLGSVILFEGDIHAARNVSKTHSSRVDTFRSAGYGKLGEVDHGKVHIRRRPDRLTLPDHGLVGNIEIVMPGLGSSAAYLDYCLSADVAGVVINAFGRGNAPRGFAAAVKRLTDAGKPVIVASRCAEGRTLEVYGGDSGATTLAAAGAIFAGELSATKSRLLLSALLPAGIGKDSIAATFNQF